MHDFTAVRRRHVLGLSWWSLLGLAALALPRVLVHDLRIEVPSWVTVALALGPPAVWVGAVLWRRVPSPVLTLVVVGLLYGVGLGISHNLLWDSVFDGAEPALGGNLEGTLPGGLEAAVMRTGVLASSILTGSLVGLISGLVAQLLVLLRGRRG